MILYSEDIQAELDSQEPNRFYVAPRIGGKLKSAASIDLRLGSWFVAPKANQITSLDVADAGNEPPESFYTSSKFVPIGGKYVLHPRCFVLAATLEWIYMPTRLCGYVTGKSSWGRRGLVIETAPGVHPGFSGCLTLEVANVGEIPITLTVGMTICQLFLHMLTKEATVPAESVLEGVRRPMLGKIKADPFVTALSPRKNASK